MTSSETRINNRLIKYVMLLIEIQKKFIYSSAYFKNTEY